MTYEEYEERMKDPKYQELKVTTKDQGKDYVFISYRSSSWKTVLTKIVYKLQKDYGLRIYFDKGFPRETDPWIYQFQENMDSSRCKAVLCFLDEGYCTSYATLLELMHAMNPMSEKGDKILSVNFPIDWDALNTRDDDTGLGKSDKNNPNYKEERKDFDREFEFLIKGGEEEIAYYYDAENKRRSLKSKECAKIVRLLQPKNQREFVDDEKFYIEYLVEPLKKMTGGSVFETVQPVDKPIPQKEPESAEQLESAKGPKAANEPEPADAQEDPLSEERKRFLEKQQKANEGDASAQNWVAYRYYKGVDGVDVDEEKAFLYYMLAAYQGHVPAQKNVGKCYFYGTGVMRNYEKAVEYFLKAACAEEKGSARYAAEAATYLSFCCEKGYGVQPDSEKAREWAEKAKGNSEKTYESTIGMLTGGGQDAEKT